MKAAQGLTFGLGGYLAIVAGYNPANVDAGGLAVDVAVKMKLLVVGLQAGGLLLAIAALYFYPITRAKAEETRRLLDEGKQNEAV